jgi:hypothetical protein
VAEIVLSGSNIAVQNNTVTGSGPNAIGIWFNSGGNNLIENNQIALAGGGSTSVTGVRIGNLSGTGNQATTTKNEILTNTITGFNIGVHLFPASETLIQDNTVHNSDVVGIWVAAGQDNRIKSNQVSRDLQFVANKAGIALGNLLVTGDQADTANSEVVGNTVSGFEVGLRIFPASITLVQSNTLVDNDGHGINIENSSRTTIGGASAALGNHIAGNGKNGIFIESVGAGNPTITTGNIIIGNKIGTNAAGTAAQGNLGAGVWIKNASNNTVGGLTAGERNIISANRQSGVVIEGVDAQNNKVLGNFIGTDVTGQIIDPDGSVDGDELGNGLTATVSPDAGISVIEGASKNIIGGDMNVGTVSKCELSCNLVSGNLEGIRIGGPNSPDPAAVGANQVLGNFIGVNVNGIAPLGNRFAGVAIFGSPDNIVGGTTAGSANLLSANRLAGVQISGASSTGNKIIGNNIGINLEGNCTVDGVPNSCLLGNFVGLRIDDGASNNTVGGIVAGSRNIISGNTHQGIRIGGTLSGSEPKITSDNVIVGNLIGLQRYNTKSDIDPWGNGGDGIFMGFGVRGNRVGGTTPAERNVISDNGRAGVRIEGSSADANLVLGNFIGTNATGSADLVTSGAPSFGNDEAGVVIDKGADNVIGAVVAPASGKSGTLECRDGCNVISQNAQGVEIRGLEAKNNQIVGNFIGADVSGPGFPRWVKAVIGVTVTIMNILLTLRI